MAAAIERFGTVDEADLLEHFDDAPPSPADIATDADRIALNVLREAITACGVPPAHAVALFAASDSYARARARRLLALGGDA